MTQASTAVSNGVRKRKPAWQTPKTRKRITNKHINDWLRIIEKGEVPVCNEQKLLAAYVRRVFATEKLIIDEGRDARYAEYESLFPFKLYPAEWFIHTMWLCVFREDGRPRWPELLWLTGRGSGKNGLIGFEALCCMTNVNGVPHYNIDICATSEDQARTSFDDVLDVLKDPKNIKRTSKGFEWNNEQIVSKSTRSKLRYRTNNPKTKDGGRPGMVIFDEVHAYTDYKNINVFIGGLGKAAHGRVAYLTTDGDVRDGVLDTMKERSLKILKGEEDDNGLLPVIMRLDSREEIDNPEMWIKANPRIAYSDDLLDTIRRDYRNWKINPAKNTAFVTKRMNLPEVHHALEVASWANIKKTARDNEVPIGTPCVIGVDYAKTTDFVSVVRIHRIDDEYVCSHHSWWCTESSDAGLVKFPLDEAEADGYLTIVNEVEVAPELIAQYIKSVDEIYPVNAIGIDMYRYTLLQKALTSCGYKPEKEGGNIHLARPSDQMLAQPVINSLFVNGKIAIGDDRLWRWFVNNAILEPATNGNYKYGKQDPHARKTDGFMAFVHGMCVESHLPVEGEIEMMQPLIL
jgi:phage terminase large subunit-like protein